MNCIQCQCQIKDDDKCFQVYAHDFIHLDCMLNFLRERNTIKDELNIGYTQDNILDLLGLNQKEIDSDVQ